MIKLVRVLPLARGIKKEELTYFTLKNIGPGTIVAIPLRAKKVLALVLKTEDVSSSKIDLKSASYKLKKITHTAGSSFFLPSFMRSAEKVARYHGARTGEMISILTSQTILRDYSTYRRAVPKRSEETLPRIHASQEQFLLQASDEDRMGHYKSLIREEFARGNSVFICFPTLRDLLNILPSLKRGIEEFVYTFHGDLSKKILFETWRSALNEKHPVLITGSPAFLCIPRPDIQTIIVEREHSPYYIFPKRPFVDARVYARFFAKELGARLIYGDLCLRTETLHQKDLGKFLEFSPIVFRPLSSANGKLVDMRRYPHERKKNTFTLLSDELKSLIDQTHVHNERLFVLTSRKGLYPTTVCSDCGHVISCPNCASPLMLHKKSTGNVFVCHKCGMHEKSKDVCSFCGSWRLTSLGIGSELVEDEIKKYSPQTQIMRLDKEVGTTKSRIIKIMGAFHASPSSVLVGTEMVVPYLKKTAHIAVASIDSLFALPDFRMNERIFSLLLRLREKAGKNFLIQSRVPETPLFEAVLQGNILQFFRNEIKTRELLRYPPFTTLIKITVSGSEERVESESKKIELLLGKWNPENFPAFISKSKSAYIRHVLLRIDTKKWPDDNLLQLLYSLPPSFEIRVNPESIL